MKSINIIATFVITVVSIISIPTIAADIQATDSHDGQAATEAAQPMSSGEVKKIDKEQGKITIKHGELKNLSMPPMTMVFRVKEPTMLDKLKVGQKISFIAENVDGALTIVKID